MKRKFLSLILLPSVFLISFQCSYDYSQKQKELKSATRDDIHPSSCYDTSNQKYISNVYANNYGQYDSKCIVDSIGNKIIIEVIMTTYDSVYIHLGSDSNLFEGDINYFSLDNSDEINYYTDITLTNIVEPVDNNYDNWITPWYFSNKEGEKIYRTSLYFKDDLTNTVYPVDKEGIQYALPGVESFSGNAMLGNYYTYNQSEDGYNNLNIFIDDYLAIPYSDEKETYIYYSEAEGAYFKYIYPQAWEEELSATSDSLKIFINGEVNETDPYSSDMYRMHEIDGEVFFFNIYIDSQTNIKNSDGNIVQLVTPSDIKYKTGDSYTTIEPEPSNFDDYNYITEDKMSTVPKSIDKPFEENIDHEKIYSQIDPNLYVESNGYSYKKSFNQEGREDYILRFKGLNSNGSSVNNYDESQFYITNYEGYYYPDIKDDSSNFMYEVNDSDYPIRMKQSSIKSEDEKGFLSSWNLKLDRESISFSISPEILDTNDFSSYSDLYYSAIYIPDYLIESVYNKNITYQEFIEFFNSIYRLKATPDQRVTIDADGFDKLNVNISNREWTNNNGEKKNIENPYLDGLLFINPKISQVFTTTNTGSEISGLFDEKFYTYSSYNGENEYLNSVYNNESTIQWWVWLIISISSLAVALVILYIVLLYIKDRNLTENKKLVKKVWK